MSNKSLSLGHHKQIIAVHLFLYNDSAA